MAIDGSYSFDPATEKDSRSRRRRIAEALLMQGTQATPIQSPWQGAARMAQALMGGLELGMEDKKERELFEASKSYNDKAGADIFGGGSAASPVTSALAGKPMGGPIKLGGFEPSVGRVLQFEGGLNPADTNGTPSNFGINQKANPDVDVANLTPQGATDIYRKRYWDAIGADKMDPRLAHVAFDTAVIAGPGKANELLKASGGDPEKFLALREQFQKSLLQRDPEKFGKYGKAWGDRVATLRADIGVASPGGMFAVGGGGQGTMAGGDNLSEGAGNADRLQRLYSIANNPMTNDVNRKLAIGEIERIRKGADPAAALAMEKARIDIAKGKRELEKPLIDPTTTEREYERAKKEGFKGDLFDFKRELAKAGASNTSVNTNPGPSKQVYETVEKRADEARAAAAALPSFAEAKRLVDSGNITLGAGADLRVSMQKVGALFGLDATSASNAETFRSVMAPTVLALVKGLGAGSGISNADREFAEKAAGGNIQLEPATIKRMIEIGAKAADAKIKAHNKMLDTVYPDTDDNNRQVRALFGVNPADYPLPTAPAEPEPAAPAVTQPGAPVRVKTPEEARKLPKGTRIILPDGSPGVVK